MKDHSFAIQACTVIARNYAAHARVLAESCLAHNPGSGFTVLIVDDPEGEVAMPDGVRVLGPADVDVDDDELARMATMYTSQGLCSAMKPRLMATMLAGGDSALLLDADSCVYAELAPLGRLAAECSIVLSPATLDTHPLQGEELGFEQHLLMVGVINGGFLAVGPGAEPFLEWWAERTARHSIWEPATLALSYSQGWLSLVPALFEHHMLRDRAYNAAAWRLGEGDVEWLDDGPWIGGARLRHFHFAGGFDPERPELLVTEPLITSWVPTSEQRPGAARLCADYAERLLAAGYRDDRPLPPLYDLMPDGTRLEPWMRAGYRTALMRAESGSDPEPPNAFGEGADSFLDWLRARSATRLSEGAELSADEAAWAGVQMYETIERLKLVSEQLDEALSSQSWRVTRPFRAAGSATRRLRGPDR